MLKRDHRRLQKIRASLQISFFFINILNNRMNFDAFIIVTDLL